MSWIHRLLLLGLLIVAAVQLPRGVWRTVGAEDLARIQSERDELLRANRAISREITTLEAEVTALKTDPRELERIAREDLNLIRPGEVVFELRRPVPRAPQP